MKFKTLSLVIVLSLCAFGIAFAEDSGTVSTGKPDRSAIKAAKETMKSSAEAGRQEEKNLRDQIHTAIQAGDYEKAKTLKEQLKTIHQANVAERKTDRQGLTEAKEDFRLDKKEALVAEMDTNKDGKVSEEERKAFRKKRADTDKDGEVDESERQAAREKMKERKALRDKDDNPPGPKGGTGTNWENRPGPKDGPGASPDRRGKKK